MMNSEINLYQILAEEFLKAGYATSKEGDLLSFSPLELTIEVELLTVNYSENQTCSVMIQVCCKHPVKFPIGIKEMSTGLGQNTHEAAAIAFNYWVAGDFPPIHDYLCSSNNLLGNYSETVSYSSELNEVIGWDLFLGPLMVTSQNMNNLETRIDGKDQYLIHRILFQAMTDTLFAKPGLYYIRTFMSKIDNSTIDCDCRVNEIDWDHGKKYLTKYIKEYQAPSGLFWIKQNLLLVNKNANEIQAKDLIQKLNQEINRPYKPLSIEKKKWWKFWI